jgi:hypothetical protein
MEAGAAASSSSFFNGLGRIRERLVQKKKESEKIALPPACCRLQGEVSLIFF